MAATVTGGRVAAWCAAWQLLEVAGKMRTDRAPSGGITESLPEAYEAIMHEADLYAQLANMPTEVGFVTGSWLQDRWDARVEAESARTATMFDDLLGKRRGGPGCLCNNPKLSCPIHPEANP